MKDFVEGNMDIVVFRNEFNNNFIIKKTLEEDPLYPKDRTYSEHFNIRPEHTAQYLEMKKWTNRGDQLNTWGAVKGFLSRYNYSFVPTKYYEDRFGFLLDIQPSWLDIDDEDFLSMNIINKIPVAINTKSEKIKWCKEKIKELFRYDKKPPIWVQNAEWPIMNGKPLIFSHQSKDGEEVHFYFYDPITEKKCVVTQWY